MNSFTMVTVMVHLGLQKCKKIISKTVSYKNDVNCVSLLNNR